MTTLYIQDDDGYDTPQLLAYTTPANENDVAAVLLAIKGKHGERSDWQWVRLQNGDLMLATFPQGDLYERFSACCTGSEQS